MPTQPRTTKHSSPLPKFILLAALFLILAALGVWAYNTYNSTKKSNTTTSSTVPTGSTQTPATPPTQTPTDTHIFKIPELGIQMTLPAGLEGLEYEVNKTTENNPKILFGTTGLSQKNNKDSYCTTDNAPLGYLVRYNKDPKNDIQASGPAIIKSFNGHYFAYYHPSQGCTADQDLGNMQDVQTKLLQDALNSLVVTE